MKQILLLALFFNLATLCAEAQKLYWIDSFTQRSWRTSDGFNDIQEITPPVPGKLNDFALDPEGAFIYYAIAPDFGSGSPMIARTQLDGSGFQVIVSQDDAVKPQQVALDLENQIVYWTDGTYPDVSIRKAGLDGSNPGVVVDLQGSNAPKGLVVDPAGGKIYWTLEYFGDIFFANLDGSDAGSFAGADNSDESSIDLAFHPAEGKLYWVTDGSFGESSKVRKASPDGSGQEVIVDLGSKTPLGIEVDTAGNKVYWSFWLDDVVQRSNLDGSEKEDYFFPEDYLDPSVVGNISDLAFDYGMLSGQSDLLSLPAAGFEIYPNPVANESLTLELHDKQVKSANLTVQILDVNGRLLQLVEAESQATLQLQHRLLPGIYRIVVKEGDRLLGSQWLIVRF